MYSQDLECWESMDNRQHNINGSSTINAILFGATGMVGEGVLHEALNDNAVQSVLVIGADRATSRIPNSPRRCT